MAHSDAVALLLRVLYALFPQVDWNFVFVDDFLWLLRRGGSKLGGGAVGNTSSGRPPWNPCRTRTPRRSAGPPSAPRGGRRGHDRPGQRVRHAPSTAKRPEDRNATAVVDRGIQTLKKDLATRVARKGGQWSDHFERAAGAYNARPHDGAPEDVEKQPATEFRVLQDNANKFQHNKDLTDRRMKAVEDVAPSERRQTRRGASTLSTARGLHDRPEHGGARDPAEAGAAGAAGQRQGGPTDETGQAGSCEAAGRLPGPRLAFFGRKCALQRRGRCGLQRSVLCKEACSAKKSALHPFRTPGS